MFIEIDAFTGCRAPLGAKCCRYAAPLGRVLFNAPMAINHRAPNGATFEAKPKAAAQPLLAFS